MKLYPVVLVLAAVTLPIFAIIGLACGGGDSAEPPTSEATRTAAPPSPSPEPTPTPTAQEVEETLGRYENSELGFAFDHPGHWEQIAVGDPVAEVGAGEVQEVAHITVGTLEGAEGDTVFLRGMDVTVNRLTEVLSEDEYFKLIDNLIVQAASQAGGALEEKDWTELAGQTARRYVLNFTFAGVPLTSEQVTAIQGDLQFTLDCQGERARFEEVRADCQVVLDSFEFTTGQ